MMIQERIIATLTSKLEKTIQMSEMEYMETGPEILIAYIRNKGLQANWYNRPRCADVLYTAATTSFLWYFYVVFRKLTEIFLALQRL